MKDCYEILGTNRNAIYYKDLLKREPRPKQEQDIFLRNVYKNKMNLIKIKQDAAQRRNNPERLRELEQEAEETKFAYEQVKSANLRQKYHQEMDRDDERQNSKVVAFRQQLRENYGIELQSEEQQTQQIKNKKSREVEIMEKYSHVSEYNLNSLIGTQKKSLNDAIVERREVFSKERFYKDKENRNLRVKQIGRINFRDWIGGQLYVDELEVRREIDGEERVDIIYANLSIPDLEVDKNTGEPINSDYYDCFANKLLAEDTIEGSKYNDGFIGGIEKGKDGNYYITLEKEIKEPKNKNVKEDNKGKKDEEEKKEESKLPPIEQQQLTAVSVWKQRERNIKRQERGEEII